MKIALIVDNPLRDLPGLVLVAAHLTKAGATVYLVPMNLQQWEVFALAPDYVLVNYCRKNNENLIRRMLAAGIRVGVLDTEGGVLASVESYGETLADDGQVRDSITCFMSWGPKLARHAVQSGWFRQDQMSVTGSPRYDFYNEAWREAAIAFSNLGSETEQPMVLFNGNFPLINPQFYTPAEEARNLVQSFGFSPSEVAEWQSTQGATMEGLVNLANALSEKFPSVRFVYRPHPFEDPKPYERLLAQRPNLQLIREGTVDGWILRSAAVIQRSCSTAIEAALADTVAISPSWLPTTRELDAANAVSYSFASADEIAEVLKKILAGAFVPSIEKTQALTEIVADWFTAVDGRAGERVALTILKGTPLDPIESIRERCARALYGLDATARQTAVGTVRRVLGLSPEFSFRPRDNVRNDWEGSAKFFDSAHVERIANAVSGASGGGRIGNMRVARAAQSEAVSRRYSLRSIVVTALPAGGSPS